MNEEDMQAYRKRLATRQYSKFKTDEMLADFFTKPLQGEKFRQFRKLILNI